MFSKKKKGDPTAAPSTAENSAVPAESSDAAANSQASPPPAQEPSQSGGLSGGLAGGLAGKSKQPTISASRLGGRPPSRPSAPAPEPSAAPPPAPPPPPAAPPGPPPVPSVHGGMVSSSNETEMSRSGRMSAMRESQGVSQTGLAPQDGAVAGAKGGKNPYKLNPIFDIILPVGMSVVLCGAFVATVKMPKDRHEIYGFTKEEKETQEKIKALAEPKLMDDVKKMEAVKLLDAGDTAGALAVAKPEGTKAMAAATEKGMSSAISNPPQNKSQLAEEEQTVRDLLASGLVLSKAGSKAEKDTGLQYLAKAEEIATYSKYVRLLYARELVRAHKDEEAVKQYESIITLFKEPWNLPRKELALLYMRQNLAPQAVEQLQYLVKNDPSDPSIQRQLGLAMAQNGDENAGFEEFQKGFTREQDVLAYPAAVKSVVEAHSGLVEAALQDVKKQADKNPDDIKLQLDLARLDIATGKLKDARDIMQKATKTQELNPEVHEVMAEVMCRQNQQTSGFDEFRSAAHNLHLQQ